MDYANLSAGAADTTFQVGLQDIEYYEEIGMHKPDQQGSVIRWNQVDWSKYGAGKGLAPEQVMRNFLKAADSPDD